MLSSLLFAFVMDDLEENIIKPLHADDLVVMGRSWEVSKKRPKKASTRKELLQAQ